MPGLWRARALADVSRITKHITSDNPIAAPRVARELLLAGDSLALFPRRGHEGRTVGTRELLAIWPYILVYRVSGDKVTILRIWHATQDR